MKSGEQSTPFAPALRAASEQPLLRAFAAVLCLVLAAPGVTAQDNFRAQLFRDADAAHLRAKEANADVLAPKSFSRAMDTYLDAKDAFQRGRPLDEIQDKIRNATHYFMASSEASKPAAIIFAGTVTARADAMSADAMRASPERWDKAESLFRSAATSLEDGDQKTARMTGRKPWVSTARWSSTPSNRTSFPARGRCSRGRGNESARDGAADAR